MAWMCQGQVGVGQSRPGRHRPGSFVRYGAAWWRPGLGAVMAARRSVLAGMLGALLTLLVVPFAAPAQAAGPAPIVRTDRGAVQGVRAGGVDSFLGIPCAAAPVGARRWTAPQPAPAWSGVKVTDRFGNRCPATESTNGPRSETENCLFVNVQRPAGL